MGTSQNKRHCSRNVKFGPKNTRAKLTQRWGWLGKGSTGLLLGYKYKGWPKRGVWKTSWGAIVSGLECCIQRLSFILQLNGQNYTLTEHLTAAGSGQICRGETRSRERRRILFDNSRSPVITQPRRWIENWSEPFLKLRHSLSDSSVSPEEFLRSHHR